MIPWHQYLFGILLILSGINHFSKPKLYERIMPPYIPGHSAMVMLSGFAEMILGFMLMSENTQEKAAWAIIILLFLYLPVYMYMLQAKTVALKMPKWKVLVGIPLQFLLMYWVYLYT